MSKPDWKDAPEWVEFIAQDMDGTWYGYSVKPDLLRNQWGKKNPEPFSPDKVILLERGRANKLWGNTLERRP